MSQDRRPEKERGRVSRRSFVKTGGAALAGSATLGATALPAKGAAAARPALFPPPRQESRIQAHRTLGRTGFQVSDVGMGTGPLREPAVVRYAFDKGINYFDTAESYGNGAAERAIGEALQHMDREKVFIATKGIFRSGDDAEAVLGRIRQSLERLNTDYIDAYSMHACSTVEALSHPGYHAAIEQLKAEGRVKFTGISYHGQAQTDQTGMADQLVAAAEDGRFDMVLFVYNFLTRQDGDRILAACKANNVGTTAMKTSPGALMYESFDPENLTDEQERFVLRFERSGRGREAGLERLRERSQRQREVYDRTLPFAEQYGIRTQDQLQLGSIHWVLQNPDMHTACVSLNDFELVDKVVALSGTPLTPAEEEMLGQLAIALDREYCRHGCFDCAVGCPHPLPVSTIMRYAYYFQGQRREKHAMAKYAALGGKDASLCVDCPAPCDGACTYGLDIRSNLLQVHDLLTLA